MRQSEAALDGTRCGGLLITIRTLLKRAVAEIGDRKLYMSYQRERLAGFEEETKGRDADAKEVLKTEIEQPFPTRAFAVDTLELIQLLCEGHYNCMQDFLREQPQIEKLEINLVQGVQSLLGNLEVMSAAAYATDTCKPTLEAVAYDT